MSGKAILKEIGSTLLYIVVVLGITWLVITFVGQRTEVNGSSMEPTLSNNDNLIVDKISYRFKDPQRFVGRLQDVDLIDSLWADNPDSHRHCVLQNDVI